MISDNNNLAVGLLVCLPLMNYLRLRSPHRLVRVAVLGAMGLTLLGIVASYSRGALLALLAVALVMWSRSRKKAAAAFVLVFVLTAAFAFMPSSWTERMDTIVHYQGDASAEDRLQIWGVAIKLALAHPLTGSGFMGPYTQSVVDTVDPNAAARSTHDIFLEVLSENGFPAFLAWLGMVVMGIINSFRLIRLARGRPELEWVQDLGRMSQVAIVAYLVGGTFLPLSYWDYFFTLMMILGGDARDRRGAGAGAEPGLAARAGPRDRPAVSGRIGAGPVRHPTPAAMRRRWQIVCSSSPS